MRAKSAGAIAALLFLGCIMPSCNRATTTGRTTITVSVGSSLQAAMQEIVSAYERAHMDIQITLNFGSSGMLSQQISNGAPVNVFFSAAPKPMDELESKGLLQPGTRRNLLRNQIVLIAPKNQSTAPDFGSLTGPKVKLIALGDPESVPAGEYGRQVLRALNLWENVQSKLVLAKDVRQVLSYVETGNADAGIVYATDALDSSQVQVMATAPESTHTPVVYPAAVVKQQAGVKESTSFVEYLSGPEARGVFVRHGFTPFQP